MLVVGEGEFKALDLDRVFATRLKRTVTGGLGLDATAGRCTVEEAADWAIGFLNPLDTGVRM